MLHLINYSLETSLPVFDFTSCSFMRFSNDFVIISKSFALFWNDDAKPP